MKVSCFHYSCDCSERTYQCFAPLHLVVTVVPLCLNLLKPSGDIIYNWYVNIGQSFDSKTQDIYILKAQAGICLRAYLVNSLRLHLKGEDKRRFTVSINLWITEWLWSMNSPLTLSSGESSVEVDTESEDMAEGGLAWADRSEREVEVLVSDNRSEEIFVFKLWMQALIIRQHTAWKSIQ